MPFISGSELEELKKYKEKYIYGNEELKEKLIYTNKELKEITLKYESLKYRFKNDSECDRSEIESLKKEIQRYKDLCHANTQKIELLEIEINQHKKELTKLENQLKMYHPKLVPHPKKVNREDVINIKELVESNSYRVVSKMTNLSIKTISRIVNGEYDKLL